MGRKVAGAVTVLEGAGSPSITQCRLGRGLPPYQVASWSIQPFCHNTPTLQDRQAHRDTHRHTQKQLSDSIGLTVLQTVAQKVYGLRQTLRDATVTRKCTRRGLPNFWSTVCYRTVVSLSVCPVCNVGVLWPNGWMEQDETWQGGRPRPGHIPLDADPAPHKGAQRPPIFGPCLLWPNGWMIWVTIHWKLF